MDGQENKIKWNERIKIKDLKDKTGQIHSLTGWVFFTRKSGNIRFIGLRDGSGKIQGVLVKEEVDQATYDLFTRLKQETCIQMSGIVQESKRNRFGVEILVKEIEIISISENFPITPKEHGTDFLLSNRHLWLRSSRQLALFNIRNKVIQGMRDFFAQHDFVQMDSPILTQNVGEDPKGLFNLSYFDLGEAYLAQTGQLYLEASIFAHGNVFCFGPTFRAEKSKTRRHLTEFWMLEAEMAFMDNVDNMDVQEDLIRFVITKVLDECSWHLKELERDVEALKGCMEPFIRLSYDEAVVILQNKGAKINWGDDLGATDETLLTGDSLVPVFVYDYPKKAKAFYMKENPLNPKTVKCADLLAPEGYGEIIGGSQREDSEEKLVSRILEVGLPIEPYQWYVDLRRYGSVKHSGFGIGLERLVGWICGIHHIRETIPFPRMMERVYP
ncbi:MAG: asparagine--tRNA ligase [Deltaproteobacteria bacterium]|nr:asparagine--tRNA ligase [Deltaproteobacteria bacterium]